MKKATVFFLLSILMIFSVSCGFQRPYHFLNSLDEVKEIMIVKLTFEDKEMMQTDLQRIENTEVFLEKFQQIPCHRRFGDPTGATEEGVENVVFRISYLNGEYVTLEQIPKITKQCFISVEDSVVCGFVSSGFTSGFASV